jgi:hypothetical protein
MNDLENIQTALPAESSPENPVETSEKILADESMAIITPAEREKQIENLNKEESKVLNELTEVRQELGSESEEIPPSVEQLREIKNGINNQIDSPNKVSPEAAAVAGSVVEKGTGPQQPPQPPIEQIKTQEIKKEILDPLLTVGKRLYGVIQRRFEDRLTPIAYEDDLSRFRAVIGNIEDNPFQTEKDIEDFRRSIVIMLQFIDSLGRVKVSGPLRDDIDSLQQVRTTLTSFAERCRELARTGGGISFSNIITLLSNLDESSRKASVYFSKKIEALSNYSRR